MPTADQGSSSAHRTDRAAYESVRVERREAVAEVVLIGPGKGNAMGPAFWREVPQVFGDLDGDESVRAVVVYGAGGNFSYGLDLPAMMPELAPLLSGDTGARGRARLVEKIASMQHAFTSIAECRKPVVAAVTGWCIGGGVDLISACDVRICSADARFSVREVRVAMVADLGSLQRLPGIIGEGHARELALTGRDIDAERAVRIGLVNDVFPSGDALLEAARELGRVMSANPPLVVEGVKRVMNQSTRNRVEDALGYVAAWNAAFLPSEDLAEAMAAFVERRAPVFRGR